MPLWLKAKRIVADETACVSEVSNEVVVSGYSEVIEEGEEVPENCYIVDSAYHYFLESPIHLIS